MNGVINKKPAVVWVDEDALNERIDSYYYNPVFLDMFAKISKNKIAKIGDFFDVTKLSGFEYTEYFTEDNLRKGDIIALTSQNVEDCKINIEDSKVIKIPKEIHIKLNRSKINDGDIILSYTGQYRRASVIINSMGEFHLGPNVCKLEPKSDEVDSAFLCVYLNSMSGQIYLDREKTISAQPTVNMDRIRNIFFPNVCMKIQKYIGNKIRKAEEVREEAMKLKGEAESILSNVLRLEEFSLRLEQCTVLKHGVIREGGLSDRLDASFYKQKFNILFDHLDTLKEQGIEVKSLNTIILNGNYGILPDSNDYGKGDLLLIRATDINEYLIDFDACEKVPSIYEVAKAMIKKDDILLEIKGAMKGAAIVPSDAKLAIVNGSIYRFGVKTEYNNFYVLAVLQSIIGQLQKEKHCANSVISYLSLEVINGFEIPIVSKEIQETIGKRLGLFCENVIQSNKLILEAKKDVEDLIEGKFDETKLSEGI